MWLDDLALTRLDGAGHQEGLTMSQPEERLKGFTGEGGLQCPGCGLKVDPKAAQCPVCGEATTGLAENGKAVALFEKMAGRVNEAKGRGIDVLYWQAAAIPMRVASASDGTTSRRNGRRRCNTSHGAAAEIIAEIEDVLAGKRTPRTVPSKPDFATMKLKGRDFCEGNRPRLIFSVHSGPAKEAEAFFSQHTTWVSTCMAPGASRFDYKEQPIWNAFNKYPDTHRVWGGGWCGHIIADKWSGGVSGANIVICLESPHTRQTCVEFTRRPYPAR